MKEELHVVLGASGSVGRAVIDSLKSIDKKVIAVGRSTKVKELENRTADMLNLSQVRAAVEGATHIYLCVGLTYDIRVWERDWPVVMSNAIAAAEGEKAVLAFIDNIYMYGPTPLEQPFTEDHDQFPSSKKGKVRKKISQMLLEAHKDGRIQGVIGRAADFYGPKVESSVLYISFIERMLQDKNPQCLSALNQKHTFAYTPDLGKALVALALNETTYGQVWHLPVSEPVTLEEAIGKVNVLTGSSFKGSRISPLILKVMGLFVRPIKELDEMMYQFNQPYMMDDRKFMSHFHGFEKTAFDDGLKAMYESFK